MKKNLLREPINKSLCPYLGQPYDDCYCLKLTSQDVEKTVYYCGNNFKICEIYKKNGSSKRKDKKVKAPENFYNKDCKLSHE